MAYNDDNNNSYMPEADVRQEEERRRRNGQPTNTTQSAPSTSAGDTFNHGIEDLYQTLLGRGTDAEGYASHLNNPNGLEGVRQSIMGSQEYKDRQTAKTAPKSPTSPPTAPAPPASPSEPSTKGWLPKTALPKAPDYSKYFEQQNEMQSKYYEQNRLMMEQQNAYLQKMQADAEARNAQIAAQEAAQKAQRDQLYGTLLGRAQQSTIIDPNDPTMKAQTQNFAANQERSRRNYMSDLAEEAGPLANLRGEQRMTAERTGINNANFGAELMGRELQNRRMEISDALNSMRGMLTNDQQANLQRELDNLDNQLGQVGAGMQGVGLGFGAAGNIGQLGLGYGGLGNNLMSALMQNNQFYSGLGSQNDQFAAQHGLNVADRASYWDALRRGLL
jgi:hypothetical protein